MSCDFLPVPTKSAGKMRGCIDPCNTNQHTWYENFKMEGLRTIQQFAPATIIPSKVDLSDFYTHFLISKADRRYMRFTREGRKIQCICTPFDLTPAVRLATKIMAPMVQYLWLCGLQLAIYIDDLILLP